MQSSIERLSNIRPDSPESVGPIHADYKYWSLLTEDQRISLLNLADELIVDYYQVLLSYGAAGVYAIKPHPDLHYPRLNPENGTHTEELRRLLLSNPENPLKSIFEIPLVLTEEEVRGFYAAAPWEKMEGNIVEPYGLSEADLFIAYMTSDIIRFGVACDAQIDETDELKKIIDSTRNWVGATSSKKAYEAESISATNQYSIRGMLGSPYFSENPARKFIFLNGVHFSSSPEEASREGRIVGQAIMDRLAISYQT